MPKPSTHLPDPQSTPKPELEKRTRRVFTAEYKLNILKQADACKYGELGVLLRREKLYHNQLAEWRREFAENGIKGLDKSLPGPTSKRSPEQKRIAQLEKEIHKLRQQMQMKEDCLALQKKSLGYARCAEQRERQIMIIINRPETLPLSMACHYLSVNRSTLYKRRFSQS